MQITEILHIGINWRFFSPCSKVYSIYLIHRILKNKFYHHYFWPLSNRAEIKSQPRCCILHHENDRHSDKEFDLITHLLPSNSSSISSWSSRSLAPQEVSPKKQLPSIMTRMINPIISKALNLFYYSQWSTR